MTRGRQANTAHVVTGQTAPLGHHPCQQATSESVLASILQRQADDISATEQIRHAQEWGGGTGHLLTLWSAATRATLYPGIDRQITARLTESEAWRYQREHPRQALQQQLRAAQLAGHDISALIDRTTGRCHQVTCCHSPSLLGPAESGRGWSVIHPSMSPSSRDRVTAWLRVVAPSFR
jgi:hypothetical protein